MLFFWLILAGVFAAVEVVSLAFYAAFIALGGLGAAAAAAAGWQPLVQVIVFGVVGSAGIVLARPALLAWLRRRREPVLVSGAEGMVGQQSILTDPIGGLQAPGHLMMAGERWPAITADGKPLAANTTVRITGIRNATLVVETVPESKASGADSS